MIVPRTPIERLLAERYRGVADGLGGADEVEEARDLLNVLAATGALGPDAVEAWRRRFERVALGPWGLPVREPAVRARARRHLDRLAAAVEAEGDPERRHAARLVASGVPRGLVATGVLSERDADAAYVRLYGSPGGDGGRRGRAERTLRRRRVRRPRARASRPSSPIRRLVVNRKVGWASGLMQARATASP